MIRNDNIFWSELLKCEDLMLLSLFSHHRTLNIPEFPAVGQICGLFILLMNDENDLLQL